MDLCIDTEILVSASQQGPCAQKLFLADFMAHEGMKLAIDEHIRQEYNEKMSDDRLGQKWIAELAANGRLTVKKRGKVKPGTKSKLFQHKHPFNSDDMTFVRVALVTESKRLIAEEPDYSKRVKQVLLREEGLCVCGCEAGCEFVRANLQSQSVSDTPCEPHSST